MHKLKVFLPILVIFTFCHGFFAQDLSYNLKKHLETLASDEMQGRKTGSLGLEKSADYIADFFKHQGLQPYYTSYQDIFYTQNQQTGINVTALKAGQNPLLSKKPVIIGAHYDHIGMIKAVNADSIANGANDNASGSAAVMQLAQLMANEKTARPIIFVLFDAEEQGLVGSKYFAEQLKNQDITPYVVFNIEMIGVPLMEYPDSGYLTGYHRSNFADIFNACLDGRHLVFSEQSKKFDLFRRSDNYPFFKTFNIPAHTVSTFDFNNYDYYHHVDDEPERMDIDHIQNLVSQWSKALLEIANHEQDIIKLHP